MTIACQVSKYPTEWDLSCFYDSIDSEELELDKVSLSKKGNLFVDRYLRGELSLSNLSQALDEYDSICRDAIKIEVFTSLYHQTRLKDEKAIAAYQSSVEWLSRFFSKLSGFIVGIQNLDYDEIQRKFVEDPLLAKYKAFIDEAFRLKNHTLSSKEESIMTKMGIVGSSAWYKFHEGLLSRIDFEYDGDERLSLSDVIERSNHGKTPKIREMASRSLSKGLSDNSYALSSIFNNIILSHQVFCDIKHYDNPEDPRFLEDGVDKVAVQNMISVMTEGYKSVCHRYYKLKARILRKDKLQYWDRCCDVKISQGDDISYSYDEAIDLVLDVFGSFSKKFHEIAKKMVAQSWVDVYPKKGKVSGAFACPASVDFHPFILLNFYGSIRDVLTIAHEFGHGIHQFLSMKNKELVCNPGLNISETASIFSEKLTYEYLLAHETDEKRRIELLCSRLDDVNNIFRQVAFFKFEQKVHELRKSRELTNRDFDVAWREVLTESLGSGVQIDECVNKFWGYITHFTNCPFYVYSYAFGCLFVEGLFEEYTRAGQDFIEKYEQVLSFGGTRNYKEIASMFGIDANSRTFWESAMSSIEKEIDDLEALCDLAIPD